MCVGLEAIRGTHGCIFCFLARLYSATYIQRYGVWSPENMVILLMAMVTQVIIVLLWNGIKKACRGRKDSLAKS